MYLVVDATNTGTFHAKVTSAIPKIQVCELK